MSSGSRLVVLTSADSPELTASLVESLSAWCVAGMLAEVVWLPASDLAESRSEAQCYYYADNSLETCSLGASLSRYHRHEVWLAALRHPTGTGGSVSLKETLKKARHTEELARQALADLLGSGITFRSLTAQVAVEGGTTEGADCTPSWDFHLVHDSNVEAHESLSRAIAADREPLGLCAMVALCASAGWRDAERTLKIEPDRFDGVLKPVRFVHCQMRLLHTPPVPLSAMQTSPPWPLPVTGGVERAQPEAVPPLSMAAYLAKTGGFVCERPGEPRELPRWSETLRLLGSSLQRLDVPAERTKSEAALERLADRTGRLHTESGGVSRLKLDASMKLRSLVQHIERSEFFADVRVPRSFVAERNPWSTVRETMFGLVDGAALPAGVVHPVRESGDVEKRLLWTDPLGVAPAYAPVDEQHAVEDNPVGEVEEEEEAVEEEQVVEHHDTLMERIAEAIGKALGEAERSFKQNCAKRSVQKEYNDAVKARREALWLAALVALGLVFLVAYAIDRRWNYLADIWELMPFVEEAAEYTSWWLVLILVAMAALVVVFIIFVLRMLERLRRLDQANAERQRLGGHRYHYASEILRLYGIAEQFEDHRLIITEFLHRPFGHFGDHQSSTLSVADVAFATAPPHSMLVAYADVEPDKLDARQQNAQESAVEPGWLNDVYERVYSAWFDRYKSRVLGEFQDPDNDTTSRQTVIHRNRRDGSEVYGARTDFAHSVVTDPNTDNSGWAIRQAATARAFSIDDTDTLIEDYLDLFGTVESVHGWQPGISAVDLFKFANRRHQFDWENLLRPGAAKPAGDVRSQSEQHFLDAPGERSLVMAWHLELTGPVRPQDQVGWQGIAADHPHDPPAPAPRPVV